MKNTRPIELRFSGFFAKALIGMLILMGGAAQAQTYKILYTFKGGSTDGANPFGGLVRDGAGNLYGTTTTGGSGQLGTVFRLNSAGAETALYKFPQNASHGSVPQAGLVTDPAGNGYGTTVGGGANRIGVIYKINLAGQTVLYSFTGPPGGIYPTGLVRDTAGNLYGTTTFGGGSNNCNGGTGCGTAFKWDTAGNFTVLHAFTGASGDGANPSGVILDSAGNLYGTTTTGGITGGSCGPTGCGTVYKIDAAGNYTILYSFTATGGDGSVPVGTLLLRKGVLYGVTLHSSCGAIGSMYSMTLTGSETVLYCFANASNGTNPSSGLVADGQGNFYGTMSSGGVCCGTVYQLFFDTGTGKWADKTLYSFTGTGGDGNKPLAPLAIDAKGNLYGTTEFGGSTTNCSLGCGIAFQVGP